MDNPITFATLTIPPLLLAPVSGPAVYAVIVLVAVLALSMYALLGMVIWRLARRVAEWIASRRRSV